MRKHMDYRIALLAFALFGVAAHAAPMSRDVTSSRERAESALAVSTP